MANSSIYAAFERMWQHIVAKLNDFVTIETLDTHVADTSNPHSVTKAQVGLGNVNNTSDADKPVSTAQQSAIENAVSTAQSYTDSAVSGLASTTSVTSAISTHNISTIAHSDIRTLISDLSTKVNNFLDVDDTTTDQLSEVLALIEANEGTLESLTSNKVNVSDIIDNLTTASASKVLSANQGVVLKGLIDALQEAVDGKAAASHTHTIANVTNLQSSLDAKAASSHTHGNITNAGAIGTASGKAVITTTNGVLTTGTVPVASGGTGATTAAGALTNLGLTATAAELNKMDGVTATTAEINKLDGLTATTAELNYMDGVTSNVQTQLDGKAASGHSHTITASASDDDVVVLTGTSGSNKVTYSASHANSGVTAGTYKSVTVNKYGHVTSGTNPTTLAGYGITDAATSTELEELTEVVDGKAASSHTHAISEVTNLQSSLDTKQTIITGGATTIASSNLTASRALISDASGKVAVSDVTSTEIGYLDGATSNIQTQLDSKIPINYTEIETIFDITDTITFREDNHYYNFEISESKSFESLQCYKVVIDGKEYFAYALGNDNEDYPALTITIRDYSDARTTKSFIRIYMDYGQGAIRLMEGEDFSGQHTIKVTKISILQQIGEAFIPDYTYVLDVVTGLYSSVHPIRCGGTGRSTLEDTYNYTTMMYRGSSLNSSETTPTISGTIAWTYE